jgi:hypothetical protein
MIKGKDKPYLILIDDDGFAHSAEIQKLLTIKELKEIIEACNYAIQSYEYHCIDDSIIKEENERLLQIELDNLGGVRRSKNITNIYIMQDQTNGYYKIGRSINPLKRERTLQSEKPTINLLYTIKSYQEEEVKLHNKYANYRIRGEWFNLNDEQIEEIKSYLESKYPVGQ